MNYKPKKVIKNNIKKRTDPHNRIIKNQLKTTLMKGNNGDKEERAKEPMMVPTRLKTYCNIEKAVKVSIS